MRRITKVPTRTQEAMEKCNKTHGGSHSRIPQKAKTWMNEGGGDLVLERKVRDTCYSMPAGLTLKFQKSHEITIPCHCNLNIKLIYKCKKKIKSQEAGPQARGRKPKLSEIGRENRKTQRLNSISFF